MIPTAVAWVPVVDISRNQGAFNFVTLRKRGVLGIIMRIAHGMTVDSLVATYYRDALFAGFQPDDIGFYSFINPKRGSGAATARFALEQIVNVRGDLDCFYMLDVENYRDQTPNIGQAPVYGPAFADYLREHIATIHTEAPETRVIGYTNRAYWNGKIGATQWVGDDVLAGELEWIVARYPVYSKAGYAAKPLPADPARWSEWAFKVAPDGPYPPKGANGWKGWQPSAGFNDQGHGYGASSDDLDLNIIYPKSWIEWTKQAPLPPPVPPPVPPQGDAMSVVLYDLTNQDSDTIFEGYANDKGLNLEVWSIPLDQAGWDHIAAATALGATVVQASVGNMKDRRLTGPLPTGDARHTWSGDEFFNAEEIKAGHAVVCHDEVARRDVEFVRKELATQSSTVDSLRALFDRFKAGLRALGAD